MAKNIVICSDGTGNRGGKTRDTNVWRVFNAVDRAYHSNAVSPGRAARRARGMPICTPAC